MKTTFEKVSELNTAFGNQKGDIFNPDVKAIRKQAKLVLEEAIEMMEAAHPGAKIFWQWDITAEKPEDTLGVDMYQILDAQGDVTTVNDGMAHVAGFDGNQVLDIVDRSNRTKFIPDAESVAPALQYYYDLGFTPADLYIHGGFPLACIKVSHDVTVGGKEYPAGKFLKNMATFVEPDFNDILDGKGWAGNTIIYNKDNGVTALIGTTHVVNLPTINHLCECAVVMNLTDADINDQGQIVSALPIVEFQGIDLTTGLGGLWVAQDFHICQADIDEVEGALEFIAISDVVCFQRF